MRTCRRQGFPAPILRRGAAMWVRSCEPNSTTSIKFAVTSGDTPKSAPAARYLLRTSGKWHCAGPIAGSCITSLDCAASRSMRSTAILSDPHQRMAGNWFWWRELRDPDVSSWHLGRKSRYCNNFGSLSSHAQKLARGSEAKKWIKLCEKASAVTKDKDGKDEKKKVNICIHERIDGNTGTVMLSTGVRPMARTNSISW